MVQSTFGRWDVFRPFSLTFGRWNFAVVLTERPWAIVARFYIFYLLVHLWKVGRYRGEIAHLPKVRA